MKPKPKRKTPAHTGQRGMILVVVLWSVAILAAVCLGLGATVFQTQTLIRSNSKQSAAQFAMQDALAYAQGILLADSTAEDTLSDSWAKLTLPKKGPDDTSGTIRFVNPPHCGGNGLEDESARLNANTVTAEMLSALPGMSQETAERFLKLREQLATSQLEGTSTREPGLTGPIASEAQLASLLSLCFQQAGQEQTPEPLFDQPVSQPLPCWAKASGADQRVVNVMQYLTVFSRQRNVDAQGRPRLNINTADADKLYSLLSQSLSQRQILAIVTARNQRPFETIGQLLTRQLVAEDIHGQPTQVEIDIEQFRAIADRITTRNERIVNGLVNVNTAPLAVLQAIPGLTNQDVQAIVDSRNTHDPLAPDNPRSNLAWLLDVLSPQSFAEACAYLTTRSQQFRCLIESRATESPSDLRVIKPVEYMAVAVFERDLQQCNRLLWMHWRVLRSMDDK